MNFLAQIPTATGDQVLNVLLGGAALLSIALIVKQLMPKRREPPIEAEFVTKKEHQEDMNAIKKDVDSIRGKMDRDSEKILERLDENKTDLMVDGHKRSATLYAHIKDLTTDIYGRLNGNDKSIAALEERTKR
jgi:hypothetical protein